MKKAFKISENYFVAFCSIVAVSKDEESMQIQINHPDTSHIDIVVSDARDTYNVSNVTIQEFKRIGREIEEYMGISFDGEQLKAA